MKKFKIGSYQLVETKKWVPFGMLRDKIKFQEVDVPPKYRFDTKEEADKFFRGLCIKKGYIEDIDQ